jgi:succinate dehydrogenase / fumarate reductase cytochrome b subunit
LVGNLQLFKDDGGAAFNIYSHFMGTNPVIRTLEWVLVLGFGFHIYESYTLAVRNRAARKVGYVDSRPSENSPWYSRSMALLGTLILIFLIVHMYNFFYRARSGAQIALCYHLIHGFRSGFQTLGLNHRKYTPIIRVIGYIFAIVVCAGFASMPIYFFVKYLLNS